jgi:O-antigen/teichoic acid export membrane protein
MFSKFRTLANHSLIYTLGDVLNLGFAFVLIPLYTTYLNPADYGILAITSTIASILSVLYLQSLEGAITRLHYDYSDPLSRKKYYGTIWILMISSTLIASLLIEGVGHQVSSVLFENVPYTPYIRLTVWTVFVTNSSLLLLQAVLRVQEKPLAFVTLNLSTFLVSMILIIYFVVGLGQGVLGSLLGRFLGCLIVAVPATIVYLRKAKLHWSWKQAKESLLFALPLIPHLLSLWVLNLSDRLILQKYVSLNEVGIYNLGYQLGSIVQVLAFSLSNAWGPFYYKTATNSDGSTVLSRMSTYYWVVIIIAGTALAMMAKEILLIIPSRPEYHIAYQVVPVIVVGFVMRAFYFIFVSALYQVKQVKTLPVVTMIAGLLNIGLNLFFVPRYGYIAAAVNTFIAYTFQTVAMYFLAQRAFPLPYEYTRVFKIAGVSMGLYLISTTLPELSAWMGLLVKTGLILTYPICLALTGFWTSSEVALSRHLLGNLSKTFVRYAR